MLDMNMFLRRKSKVGQGALQCLEWKEAEISGSVAKGRLWRRLRCQGLTSGRKAFQEEEMARKPVWLHLSEGGRESGRCGQREKEGSRPGKLRAWAFYMERPLSSDQDLACCAEESGLFLHPGESH